LNRARPEFEANLASNEFLVTVPEPRKVSETRPVFSTVLINLHVHERGSIVFPRETRGSDLLADRDANIDEAVWKSLRQHFRLSGERRDDPARQFVARLFRAAFAILHAPAYQFEHASALSADWAHLPIAKDRKLFDRIVEAGEQIVRLLDANRDASSTVESVLGHERASFLGAMRRRDGGQLTQDDLKIAITYWGGGKGQWRPREYLEEERPAENWAATWGQRTGDLFINESAFFSNVPEAVWTYQLGGYPVLKKWLGYRQSDRRGGPLNNEERQWFRSMIQRVAVLLALGPALDALYQEASVNYFTSVELGISPDAARLRREAKKMKKSASREKTPAIAQNLKKRRRAKMKNK
jgi:hypothetical protein